ncbi:MAG: radical SAM protein [Candidatus Firestonebacteria bacterium]|nr:radical SAM protein [Candidatus Firestonebacteria bacterium]
MKIMIAFPPLSGKGCPMLGQNRQFQWFSNACYIYPMVPAGAASLLKSKGYEVIWADHIAEEKKYSEFIDLVSKEKPDVIMLETKTPVVKQHWKIIDDLKAKFPRIFLVLVGDHVTAMPKESMESCKVDFVLTGGDYDFLLLDLINNFSKSSSVPETFSNGVVQGRVDPGKLEPGIWYRDKDKIMSTGVFQLNHDLNTLPSIDRELTKWYLYSEKNGNYKKTPGTYTMAGRDCWWGKCTFCSWTTIYPKFRVVEPDKILDEIGNLIEKYHVKEIMDDTGCFPKGEWLKKFCEGMITRGYNKKVIIDCNMRFTALSLEEYKLMKNAGFRLVLFGLESANPKTLKKVCKGVAAEDIVESCKLARKAGLFPHITIMFGYPWENFADIMNTVKLGKYLMRKGYAYTLQSTIVIPYPGTPLFDECKKEGLLNTTDWDRYDMREQVMKSEVPEEKIAEAVRSVYRVAFNPEFIVRKILAIRDMSDIMYFIRAVKHVLGHLVDFKGKK